MRRAKWEKVKKRISNLPAPRPPPKKEPAYLPLSTPRARLSKRRRRQGLRLVSVLLNEEHLDALIKLGFLPRDQRATRTAIQNALAAYLYASLIERFANTVWAKMEREARQANRPEGRPKPPLSPEPAP